MMGIIDVDRHVIEPIDIWSERVEPHIFRQFPISIEQHQMEVNGKLVGYAQIKLAGQSLFASELAEKQSIMNAIKSQSNDMRAVATHPITQLKTMDGAGIHRAYLMPSFAVYIVNHQHLSAEASIAYAHSYNGWLHEYVSVQPERLRGVGLISRHQPEDMLRQLKQVIEFGWRSVVMTPEMVNGRMVGDKAYWPFYQACAKHNIAVIFHNGTNLSHQAVGSDRFSSWFALHACSHPLAAQLAFVSLLESGIFNHCARLKLGFLEAGCSWLPYWLWRLDNVCYSEGGAAAEQIKRLPSDYFRHHCWLTLEPNEPCIEQVIDIIGHHKLLYGSDFPHVDHLDINLADSTVMNIGLSKQSLDDIFVNNALALFEQVND